MFRAKAEYRVFLVQNIYGQDNYIPYDSIYKNQGCYQNSALIYQAHFGGIFL